MNSGGDSGWLIISRSSESDTDSAGGGGGGGRFGSMATLLAFREAGKLPAVLAALEGGLDGGCWLAVWRAVERDLERMVAGVRTLLVERARWLRTELTTSVRISEVLRELAGEWSPTRCLELPWEVVRLAADPLKVKVRRPECATPRRPPRRFRSVISEVWPRGSVWLNVLTDVRQDLLLSE